MIVFYVFLILIVNYVLLRRVGNIFTLRSIFLITYLVYYPLTFCFVYYLTLHFDLDVDLSTYILSMHAYSLMLLVILIIEFLAKKRPQSDISALNDLKLKFKFSKVKVSRVFVLYIFFIAALVIRLSNGIFFHVSINPDYNISDTATFIQNSVDRLSWIGILPVFLFWLLYVHTKKKTYLIYMIFLASLSVALYIPSGKRMLAIGFLPVLSIYMFATFRTLKMKVIFTLCSLFFMSFIIILLGNLRVAENVDTSTQQDILLLADRLADFNFTGMVIERVPAEYPFRYFDGFDDIYHSIFPSIIRAQIGFPVVVENGAVYAGKIGLSPGDWTSVPLTFLGDSYSRLGWFGIAIFTLIFYGALKLLDLKIFDEKNLFSIISIILLESSISQFYVSSILTNFRNMTRDLLVILIISHFIAKWLYSAKAELKSNNF